MLEGVTQGLVGNKLLRVSTRLFMKVSCAADALAENPVVPLHLKAGCIAVAYGARCVGNRMFDDD